jgi:hypothetical protein
VSNVTNRSERILVLSVCYVRVDVNLFSDYRLVAGDIHNHPATVSNGVSISCDLATTPRSRSAVSIWLGSGRLGGWQAHTLAQEGALGHIHNRALDP